MGPFLRAIRNLGLRRGWGPVFLRLALLAGLPAAAQEPRTVRVGVDSDCPPFEWVDASGQPQGYTVELFRTVAKTQGLRYEFRVMGWREVRAAFERGEIDALTGMASSERRIQGIDFSIPHSTLTYSILTREGDSRIRSERDLAGLSILAEEGDVLFEYLVAQGLRVIGANSPRDALERLARGDGDCAVVPTMMWRHLEKYRRLPRLHKVPSEVFLAKYCFAVRKGQEALLAKLNDGLFQAKQDGTMDALYNRYLGSLEAADLPLGQAFRRALPVLATGMLVAGVLGLVAWTWMLRRRVETRTAALNASVRELEAALAQVKKLSGLIPMCAGCKKIRADSGYWEAVEDYISRHSEAQFSHGLCPDCTQHYFPGFGKPSEQKPEA